MMRKTVVMSLLLVIAASSSVLAIQPGKKIEFKGSPEGTVIFDGTTHKNAGLTCKDCHNPVMFPEMKQGTVKITMKDLYAGKYCGRCHDGKKAFQILANCSRCHHKEGMAK